MELISVASSDDVIITNAAVSPTGRLDEVFKIQLP